MQRIQGKVIIIQTKSRCCRYFSVIMLCLFIFRKNDEISGAEGLPAPPFSKRRRCNEPRFATGGEDKETRGGIVSLTISLKM